MRRRALCVLFLLVISASEGAASDPDGASLRSDNRERITSRHRNFIVTDMPKRDAVEIAAWAEEVQSKIEDWAGRTMPAGSRYPLLITAEVRTNEPGARLLWAQNVDADGRFRQEMTMINPALLDQEDALELLSSLLLNRWLQALYPAPAGKVPGRIPDWLAVGVAQNLYTTLRTQNREALSEAEGRGVFTSPVTVFNARVLPPGRWPDKALAGLLVEWMAFQRGSWEMLEAVFSLLGKGSVADASALVALADVGSAKDMCMAFDVWLMRQREKIIPGVDFTDASGIFSLVQMQPGDTGLVHPALANGEPVTARMLIASREEPWVRRLAVGLSGSMARELVGKSADVVNVAQPFVQFYRQLAFPEAGRHVSSRELTKTWDKAMRDLKQYQARYEARRKALDMFAGKGAGGGEASLERLGRMLDRWESSLPVRRGP